MYNELGKIKALLTFLHSLFSKFPLLTTRNKA
jgi:hypothetical protein